MGNRIVVGVLLVLSVFSAHAMSKESNTLVSVGIIVDDEYDQFRKQGDELFKAGQYEKALKKYLSCLEVPGFERDVYAIGRIEGCQKAIELKAEVMRSLDTTLDALGGSSPSSTKDVFVSDSLFISQFEKVLTSFQAILKLNPEDASMRELAFTYWSAKGNQAMNKRSWEQAREWFEKALEYKFDGIIDKKLERSVKMIAESVAIKKAELVVIESNVKKPEEDKVPQKAEKVVQDDLYSGVKKEVGKVSSANNTGNSDDVRSDEVEGDVVRPPSKKEPLLKTPITITPLQIGLSGLATVGFITAISLNSGWQKRLQAIERNAPSVNRTVYLNAYQDAVDYRSKVGLRNTSLVLSFAALGVDALLFLRKPKPSNVSVRTEGVGINIQVRF